MTKTQDVLKLADEIEGFLEQEELAVAMTACLLAVVQMSLRDGLNKTQIAKGLRASATAVLKAF